MKRRFLSLLLCLCLVVSLFAMTGATAFADGETQTYTVALGDTLMGICAAKGVDYNKNVAWILAKNNLKSADSLPLGKVLTLPAAGKVYTVSSSGSTSTSTSSYSVPTQTYTMQSGDIVIKVCQKLGVDFYANEAWIMAANKITSWNSVPVGKVLVLPAAGTKPAVSTAAASNTTTTTTTPATSTASTTTTATTSSTGTNLSLKSGDTVRYYMVEYFVKQGDTLGNISSANGVDVATLQQLNSITNAAKIYVGQKLSIPSTKKPTSGSFTAIVAHSVKNGETVQAICTSYGMGLDANLTAQLKALNNKTNLNKIQVGETLLIPVKGVVTTTSAAASTSTGSTGSSTSSSTAAAGATYYTLNKSGAPNGTYSLTVNGQAVNGAAADQTVHVVATADHGYKLAGVTVTKVYNGAAVAVDSSNNFVMPACDVNVLVSFVVDPTAAAHAINKSSGSAPEASLTFVVNGYSNTTAEPGQTVRIVLSKLTDGYYVDGVYVTTKNGDLAAVKAMTGDDKVEVNSDFTFTMPAKDVFVTVSVNAS